MATATMSGADGSGMEQKKFEYFCSINSMARKIMEEREKIKQRHGSAWEKMSPNEQDTAIDNGMMDPHIRARYAMHKVEREEVICYPKLLIQTGQKIVHFGEEDLTWQDEHSAPFSWETKSQLDFNMGAPSELPASSASSLPSSQPSEPVKPIKPPQSSGHHHSNSIGGKPSVEVSFLGHQQEEESSFWKISAERSKMADGERGDLFSLTPSQIKSLEKGEKPLPSYLRPETPSSSFLRSDTPSSFLRADTPSSSSYLRADTPSSTSSYLRHDTPSPAPSPAPPKEPDEHHHHAPAHPPARSAKQRAPRPPAPPPPIPVPIAVATTPAAISVTPGSASMSVSSTVAGWERAQSTLPSVSNAPDDVFAAGLPRSPARSGEKARENAVTTAAVVSESPPPQAGSPTFGQFNTSSNILKTGFDFLDNW